jgi:hypothetical protein
MREPAVLAAVIFAAAVACVAGVAVLRGERGTQCRSALVPAYVTPEGLERLAAQAVPGQLVIFNPASGPHSQPQPAYRRAALALQRSGIRVLGYVPTAYGSRDAAAVESDVARYRSWYGVDGIFLDEVPAGEAHLGWYAALSRSVRAAGARVVVLNPGAVPARGYFEIADVVVTFEGPYASYAGALAAMPEWLRDMAPGRSAHLIYAATAEQAERAAASDPAGFVYATTGALPNPWSALPPYLDRLEARLDACWRESGDARR